MSVSSRHHVITALSVRIPMVVMSAIVNKATQDVIVRRYSIVTQSQNAVSKILVNIHHGYLCHRLTITLLLSRSLSVYRMQWLLVVIVHFIAQFKLNSSVWLHVAVNISLYILHDDGVNYTVLFSPDIHVYKVIE